MAHTESDLFHDRHICENVTDIAIEPVAVTNLEFSSKIGELFEPNAADEPKRFGCYHLEVDGKAMTTRDVQELIEEIEELKKTLRSARKSCRSLRTQLKDERRKSKIRRDDFRSMQSLLQKYSEVEG